MDCRAALAMTGWVCSVRNDGIGALRRDGMAVLVPTRSQPVRQPKTKKPLMRLFLFLLPDDFVRPATLEGALQL